jgi:quinol-cytochrome oxidoreductase complex cytochrome b subunit
MKKTLLALITTASSCFLSYAQITQPQTQVQTPTIASTLTSGSGALTRYILSLQVILNKLVPLSIGFAFVGFLFFLVKFIWKSVDNPTERQKAKEGIFWSIVALFVMMSVWGIVAWLANLLGTGVGGSMPPFKLPGES